MSVPGKRDRGQVESGANVGGSNGQERDESGIDHAIRVILLGLGT